MKDDPHTAAVKADTDKRLAGRALDDFVDWLAQQRLPLRKLYTELFYVSLLFATLRYLGVSIGGAALIAIVLCITPWWRYKVREPATVLMLLILVDWAGLLPLTKWTQALLSAINHAVGHVS